ncbi:MAG: hypothetical protein E7580_03610 [Ruminococcaceae bacterium]|nr:hypothetical protein [Oscillospiraceae bacterium]
MKAIVFTSKNGHTAEYARILGEKTDLPVYSLEEAGKQVEKGAEIIYLGWLFASSVKGYKKAAKRYRIAAVCAVGLCDTGTALDQVRKANGIPDALPLFTMQGGMDKASLRGINKWMIGMLIKGMEGKQNKTEEDQRMLYLLKNDRNYVCEENTADFMKWYASIA